MNYGTFCLRFVDTKRVKIREGPFKTTYFGIVIIFQRNTEGDLLNCIQISINGRNFDCQSHQPPVKIEMGNDKQNTP